MGVDIQDTDLAREVTPFAEEYRRTGAWSGPVFALRFRAAADAHPHRTAVVDRLGQRRVTYGDVDRLAAAMTVRLASLGVVRGDRIVMQLPNCLEAVLVALAASHLGATVSPVLPNYRTKELSHILGLTEAKLLIAPMRYRGHDYSETVSELNTVTGPGVWSDLLLDLELEGTKHLEDHSAGGWPPAVADDPSAVSVILFTSGTTSRPKAVQQTDELLNANFAGVWQAIGLTEEDIVWMPSPVGHSTGFNWGIRFALSYGLPLVLQDRWVPSEALELIERERPTFTVAATVFVHDLLAAADREPARDLSSLRAFGCGGAAVPPDVVERAHDRGVIVLRLYGLSETEIATTTSPSDDLMARLHTDGAAVAHTDVEIRDDRGRGLGPGEIGEIFVRGPGNSVGYLKDKAQSLARWEKGWVRSGDLGCLSADGYLTVVGRKSDMIIRGGTNISPRELEEALLLVPQVLEAAVIGIPHERLGEIVCACVILQPSASLTLEELSHHLLEGGLAKYKLPEALVFFDAFPLTSSGKVQRTQLREKALHVLGSTTA